ncbi:MAG: DinB family protein [Chitinophagales bacterium]|nr:DinB family protein [Chitinophagales bacterium]MCZ2392788.1 DinB family protein [Chitinophagales bacterium]
MKHSDLFIAPSYANSYFDRVQEDNLIEAIQNSIKRLQEIDILQWEKLDQKSYFPGKWTLNELLQHLIDTERIITYRATTFARQDLIELPGFDEDYYVAHSYANDRTIEELLQELIAVRISTFYFFKSLNPRVIHTVGKINGNDFSINSLGFFIIGHAIHHFNVITSRYLPLLF